MSVCEKRGRMSTGVMVVGQRGEGCNVNKERFTRCDV